MVVRCREARRVVHGAVDIAHIAADAADQVMVVVADACFESGRGMARLDAPKQAALAEGAERVVDRLMRDGAELFGDRSVDAVGGAVGVVGDRIENRDPLGGDVEPSGSEGRCVFGVLIGHDNWNISESGLIPENAGIS